MSVEYWWEDYWQGKTELLFEKFNPVALCWLQILHGLSRTWNRHSRSVWSDYYHHHHHHHHHLLWSQFLFLVLIRLVLHHSGFKLQIVALPLLCVVPSIAFFFQSVLSACLVLFSDTSLAVVIILMSSATTLFHFPHALSICTKIFIFEFFSLFCIIFMMIVIINDKIYKT